MVGACRQHTTRGIIGLVRAADRRSHLSGRGGQPAHRPALSRGSACDSTAPARAHAPFHSVAGSLRRQSSGAQLPPLIAAVMLRSRVRPGCRLRTTRAHPGVPQRHRLGILDRTTQCYRPLPELRNNRRGIGGRTRHHLLRRRRRGVQPRARARPAGPPTCRPLRGRPAGVVRRSAPAARDGYVAQRCFTNTAGGAAGRAGPVSWPDAPIARQE